MNKAYDELRNRVAEVVDLFGAMAVLGWDHRTMMPRNGAAARAEQLGTLAQIAHTKAMAPEIGKLLDELEPWAAEQDYDSTEASLIRLVRRDYDKVVRVPPELSAEMSRTAATAEPVWQEARKASDWSMFQPYLEKVIELRRRYVDCFEPADEDYDILLDDFEPGMKTAEVRAVFDELKEGLVPLIAEIAERHDAVDDSFLHGDFPIEAQKRVEGEILAAFGFTADSWRLDETVHPFASRSGPDDIRLTTKHLPRQPQLDLLVACTSSATGSTSTASTATLARTTARARHVARLPRVPEPHVGEPRRPQPAVLAALLPARPGGVPGAALGRRRGGVLPRGQPRAALADPHRGGRGDVQPPHHPPLRARAGDDHRPAGRRRRARGVGREDARSTSGSRCPTSPTARFRTRTGPAARSATSRPTRSATSSPRSSGSRSPRRFRTSYEQIGRGEFGELREWLRENVHRHGRKYLPARAARADHRRRPRPAAAARVPAGEARRDLRPAASSARRLSAMAGRFGPAVPDRPDLRHPLRRAALRPDAARTRDRGDQRMGAGSRRLLRRPDDVRLQAGVRGGEDVPRQGRVRVARRHPGEPRLAERRLRPLRGVLRRAELRAARRRRDDRRRRLDRARPRPRPDRPRPLRVDRGAVRRRRRALRVFVLHHHLLPVPGTGRERNIVYDAGDAIECLQRAQVDLVLCGPQARSLRVAARGHVHRQHRHRLVAAAARQHAALLQRDRGRRRARRGAAPLPVPRRGADDPLLHRDASRTRSRRARSSPRSARRHESRRCHRRGALRARRPRGARGAAVRRSSARCPRRWCREAARRGRLRRAARPDLEARSSRPTPEIVVDLSDEPVLGPRAAAAARVAGAGARPSVRRRPTSRSSRRGTTPVALPSIAVIGTGKRDRQDRADGPARAALARETGTSSSSRWGAAGRPSPS